MGVLLTDDFNTGSLDTGKWSTVLGFSGGTVAVHDGICELDGGTLNPTILYSSATFNRDSLFMSIAIPTATGTTVQFGFMHTDITHRIYYSSAYPGSILYSANVIGHTTPSGSYTAVTSALMDASANVFGLSLEKGISGTYSLQMWQLLSTVWHPVGGQAGITLAPTYDYNVFVLTGNSSAIGVDWIKLEDALPSSNAHTYYTPAITGHLNYSNTTFSTPGTH